MSKIVCDKCGWTGDDGHAFTSTSGLEDGDFKYYFGGWVCPRCGGNRLRQPIEEKNNLKK